MITQLIVTSYVYCQTKSMLSFQGRKPLQKYSAIINSSMQSIFAFVREVRDYRSATLVLIDRI